MSAKIVLTNRTTGNNVEVIVKGDANDQQAVYDAVIAINDTQRVGRRFDFVKLQGVND